MVACCAATTFINYVTAQSVNYYYGEEYDKVKIHQYPRGRIVEFTNGEEFCNSYILVPGMSILPRWFLGIVYFVFLLYLFVGISIISDIFMAGIERITSTRRDSFRDDGKGGKIKVSIPVWNPTMANLTLMAFGSSAPEILLNTIETIKTLDSDRASELGIATIIGSASFNFLVITGISIAAVSEEEDTRDQAERQADDTPLGVKKIRDVGVFTTTTIFSLGAYAWLFYCLYGDREVTLVEAIITFAMFFVLLALAYCADRIHAQRTKDRENAEYGKIADASQNPDMNVDGAVVAIDKPLGRGAFIPPIPYTAFEVYNHLIPEERGVYWATEEGKAKSKQMRQFL